MTQLHLYPRQIMVNFTPDVNMAQFFLKYLKQRIAFYKPIRVMNSFSTD